MTVENRRQYEHTKAKLQELETLVEKKQAELGDDHVRELTLRSLKKRIVQFQEELARFETRSAIALHHK
jgi:hypothetical protein